MDFIQANLIDPVNKALYTYILVYLLVAVGIYFTIRTRFVQFRYFPRMLKQLFHSRSHDAGISPFQAFCVGLASRVGTGRRIVTGRRAPPVYPGLHPFIQIVG